MGDRIHTNSGRRVVAQLFLDPQRFLLFAETYFARDGERVAVVRQRLRDHVVKQAGPALMLDQLLYVAVEDGIGILL